MAALVAWLRADINRRMDRLDERLGSFNERLARIEAMQVEQGERLTRIETMQAEQGECLTRIEATLSAPSAAPFRARRNAVRAQRTPGSHRDRTERVEEATEEMETGLHAMSGELANTNERMAPIEGAFAGAPGRPFPELMAYAPGGHER